MFCSIWVVLPGCVSLRLLTRQVPSWTVARRHLLEASHLPSTPTALGTAPGVEGGQGGRPTPHGLTSPRLASPSLTSRLRSATVPPRLAGGTA